MNRIKLWLLLAALALPMMAQAENLLGVAPLRTVLTDLRPSDVISLTNRSERRHVYKLTLQDHVMNEKGQVRYQDDGNFAYSAKRMLRFLPRTIKLEAGERQNVRVMFTQPANLPDGEYHAHLVFDEVLDSTAGETEVDNKLKVNVTNLYSVGLPIRVQKGKISSTLVLQGARITTVEKTKAPAISVSLQRMGNAEATGLIRVFAEDDKKQENLVAPRTAHVYREVDNVTIEMPFKDGKAPAKGTKLVTVMERDGKLLGKVNVAE